jgi:2'-5' RNA ligase
MSRFEHSFWLLPAEPLSTRLRGVVAELAAKYDTAPFEPHVTLYCGLSDDRTTSAVLERVAAQFRPMNLAFEKLDRTEEYTKTLFVQFEESSAARELSETIRSLCAQPSDYGLNPHLSLIYGALQVEEKLEIMRSLDLPEGDYRFDRIAAIETEIPLTQADQIRRWRLVGQRVLGPVASA